MARPVPLTGPQIEEVLTSLPGWGISAGRLHRELRFASFSSAFGFMAAVAVVAAEMDHHPDWSNSYTQVTIDLVSHDVGGVTELDVALARRISTFAESHGAR